MPKAALYSEEDWNNVPKVEDQPYWVSKVIRALEGVESLKGNEKGEVGWLGRGRYGDGAP